MKDANPRPQISLLVWLPESRERLEFTSHLERIVPPDQLWQLSRRDLRVDLLRNPANYHWIEQSRYPAAELLARVTLSLAIWRRESVLVLDIETEADIEFLRILCNPHLLMREGIRPPFTTERLPVMTYTSGNPVDFANLAELLKPILSA